MWKRLSVVWAVVKGDARLLWYALQHPGSPGWLKLGTAGLVLYLVSPVDFIPDVIPFFGVMDDIVVVPLAMRWLLKQLPAQVRADIERRARGEADVDVSTAPRGSKPATTVVEEVR
jgi:uncharacterized membrane protein YkvA (DUF1232 family)